MNGEQVLTPKRYWRIAASHSGLGAPSAGAFRLPSCVAEHVDPPQAGDGLIVASYDEPARTGHLVQLGVIRSIQGRHADVDWRPTDAAIWIDSAAGIGNWKGKEGFAFARSKVAGYGLHALFAKHFVGMEARDDPADCTRPRLAGPNSRLTLERLRPMEVVGSPTADPRGGYVYVLESAYGFKVGRTRSLPDRMRAFAVRLPFTYTIPLCVWFRNSIDAESRYHRLFAPRRINGEWFDLSPADVDRLRLDGIQGSATSPT
jgi:hypothetical protein